MPRWSFARSFSRSWTMYQTEVLADSIGPHGVRLTTVESTFPRRNLAELNTHGMLSLSSESNRAIPPEIQIERVIDDPYIPEFAERAKGMASGKALVGPALANAVKTWLEGRDQAILIAQRLLAQEITKEQINALLEPWQWHTVIITATDWDNFLNLRDHEAAAIPMQRLARGIRAALGASEPKQIGFDGWHLPLVPYMERAVADLDNGIGAKVSAGRCARSSYSHHRDPEDASQSVERWDRLAAAGHWSPAQHPAKCVKDSESYVGQYRGWLQLRKFYPNEAIFSG